MGRAGAYRLKLSTTLSSSSRSSSFGLNTSSKERTQQCYFEHHTLRQNSVNMMDLQLCVTSSSPLFFLRFRLRPSSRLVGVFPLKSEPSLRHLAFDVSTAFDVKGAASVASLTGVDGMERCSNVRLCEYSSLGAMSARLPLLWLLWSGVTGAEQVPACATRLAKVMAGVVAAVVTSCEALSGEDRLSVRAACSIGRFGFATRT